MAKFDNQAVPYNDPGDTFTGHCASAVTGKRFLSGGGAVPDATSGNFSVAHTGAAAGKCIGVSAYDSPSGDEVTVWHARSIIVPVEVGTGGVTAGDFVEAAAGGLAVTRTAGVILGMALDTAAAGAFVPVDRSITA